MPEGRGDSVVEVVGVTEGVEAGVGESLSM
jgi:hypothetical protein